MAPKRNNPGPQQVKYSYNHERIKQSLGWMSPVQYRQSQGMAA